VIPACPELRPLHEARSTFAALFARFAQESGPAVTGPELSSAHLLFNAAFDPFLRQAARAFCTAATHHGSSLTHLAGRVVREWQAFVAAVNRLREMPTLPHVPRFQSDFDELSRSVCAIASLHPIRSYYRDALFLASNSLKHEIVSLYRQIYAALTAESSDRFDDELFRDLKRRIQLLSREIQEDYIPLFPYAMTTTPEMKRRKNQVKAICGDAMALLESAFFFRVRTKRLLNQMAILHYRMLQVLDQLAIPYQVDVAPIETPEMVGEGDEKLVPRVETPEERVESFVSGLTQLLNVDMSGVTTPIEKLDVVERTLKKVLAPVSRSHSVIQPHRDERPRKSSIGGRPPSLWEGRERAATRIEAHSSSMAHRGLPLKTSAPVPPPTPRPALS
jgi:hypothetical protein